MADSIWPHLKSAFGPERPASKQNASLAELMYPQPLQPQPRSAESESLLRHLRELRARIDARLKREGRQ